ncbi:MAG: hypothetical protein U1E05_20890, partial [Patescibacteria group bacterium]|nr:hypothetical protein [Patescibacteria group bacterium]
MNTYKTHTVQPQACASRHDRHVRGGYTLVEILVATTLTLILMFAVVQIFAMIGGSVSESRALLEMNDRLRSAKTRLQMDLDGMTVVPLPPRSEEGDGYLEIIEGPVMAPNTSDPGLTVPPKYLRFLPWLFAANSTDSATAVPDTTVGDFDDILMFTTRDARTPFIGRYYRRTVESDIAEVSWFVRGRTLYRRVLLIRPDLAVPPPDTMNPNKPPYYLDPALQPSYHSLETEADPRLQFRHGHNYHDLSIRPTGDTASPLAANTLADLARRENRYAHRSSIPLPSQGSTLSNQYAFDVREWHMLGLPTLRESDVLSQGYEQVRITYKNPTATLLPLPKEHFSSAQPSAKLHPDCELPGQVLDSMRPAPSPPTLPGLLTPALPPQDFWTPDESHRVTREFTTPGASTRQADDVILTNVIGFDVKVFDPQAPIYDAAGTLIGQGTYVDLGYLQEPWASQSTPFSHAGNPASDLAACVLKPPPNPNNDCGTCVAQGLPQCRRRRQRIYDTWTTSYLKPLPAFDPADPATWEQSC